MHHSAHINFTTPRYLYSFSNIPVLQVIQSLTFSSVLDVILRFGRRRYSPKCDQNTPRIRLSWTRMGSIPLSRASPRRPLIGKINFPRSSGYVDRIKVGGLDIRAESNVRLFGYGERRRGHIGATSRGCPRWCPTRQALRAMKHTAFPSVLLGQHLN